MYKSIKVIRITPMLSELQLYADNIKICQKYLIAFHVL